MIKAEMTISNHTSPTVAETVDNRTVDTRTVDIDMDILKKERDLSDNTGGSQLPEKWTNLNDNTKHEEGGDTENSGSVTSEPKRQFSRRNSNESTYSAGSAGSSGSKSSKNSAKRKSATKRRSWKKPKDKPKRPLSAYNIFFKHTRSRIVEGLTEEGTTEETIASIEGIVANSTETRRHRKTHGQISFGDLARTIAEKWKTIDKNQRALFDHYAALDMKRYRRDVSIWKAKKETEALAASSGNNSHSGGRRPSPLDISANSAGTTGSMNYMTDSQTTLGVGENYDDWNTPQYRALSTSFNSIDSEEDYGLGLEPLPIGDMQDSQNAMIGGQVPSYIESNPMNNGNSMMSPNDMGMSPNNGYNNTPNSNSSLNNKKLRDIWMKNRQLEESINKLKKELSQTNFSLGGNNSNSNMNVNVHPDQSPSNQKFASPSLQVSGPSIDRMQQLHRQRMLRGDIMPPMGNGQNPQNNQGLSINNDVLIDDKMQMNMDPFDMNPVPIDEVFSGAGAEAKNKELITNLGHLDFFAGNGGGC